ncbi:MAG: HEAT repeat domain-containing protein [Gemmatimonadaceae bacterium]|nr:HEAT repeat domain-containing protein [Gemmatimonadaceae bacterium]
MFRLPLIFALGAVAGGSVATSRHHAPLVPTVGVEAVAVAVTSNGILAPVPGAESARPIMDVRGLLGALHGLPGVVCGLAAEAASGWGGGSWMNAPAPPLGPDAAARTMHFPRARLTPAEIRMVLDSIASPDPCVRELSVRLVGRLDTAFVEAPLRERLASSNAVATREAAALALGLVRARGSSDALQRLLGEDSDGLRANAVWALGRLDDKQVAPAVRRALRDDADLVRDAAAAALGTLDDDDAVDELLRVLRTDKVARVRRTAAWALGRLDQKRAGSGLVSALGAEQDDDVRETIVWALGTIEVADAAPAITEVLRKDRQGEVREMAAWALGQLESAAAVDALGEAAGGDAEPSVRATAAWALGQLELRQAPAGLIRAVTDKDAEVRTRAAWALSEIHDARAINALRSALKGESAARARKAQIRALVLSGEKSEAFFKELLTSDDPEVREAAVGGMAGQRMHPWPWPMPRPRPFPE